MSWRTNSSTNGRLHVSREAASFAGKPLVSLPGYLSWNLENLWLLSNMVVCRPTKASEPLAGGEVVWGLCEFESKLISYGLSDQPEAYHACLCLVDNAMRTAADPGRQSRAGR